MSISKTIKGYLLKRLGQKKHHTFNLKEIKHILFLRYDRIGDMILTTPLFKALKTHYPNITLSVLASPSNKEVLKNNPYVDHIYINHKHHIIKDYSTLKKLRKQQFDVAIEFDPSVIPHAMIRLKIIQPKTVISVYKEGRYGVKGSELSLYDHFTSSHLQRHFKDIWMETLRLFHLQDQETTYTLFPTSSQYTQAQNFLAPYQSKACIGINLEGTVKGKEIDYTNVMAICHGIKQHYPNITIIILHTPNKHLTITAWVQSLHHNWIIPSYRTDTILDLSALVSKLNLIITPDTSVVHIASAFNRPVITIHENNPLSYQRFAPTSQHHHTVFSQSHNRLIDYNTDEIINYAIKFLQET